jgi:hypothetical protein
MVIDELNGIPVEDSGNLMLKAGAQVEVRGHVSTWDGVPASDFSGVLYASVFDNVEEVVCRNNAKADITPFSYSERTKKFFVGSDSIKDGEFSFTFRVPLDINYSQENGLINLYAVDSTYRREAKGSFENFLLGGTEENLSDDKQEELDKILQINQPLQEAYLLKEKLRLVFQFSSFKKCASAFGEWIALAEASTLKPFNRLAKTLSRHAQQVLNFFRYRLTSGRIEGMNSMIARIQLKTQRLPSIDYLRLKLRQLTSVRHLRDFFDAEPLFNN